MENPTIEFMIRVKLPSPNAYASCPSGDTEYATAYHDAIFAATPLGFEVYWPRPNEKWPVDSEGFTWVRLFCADNKMALASTLDELRATRKRMEEIQAIIKTLL